MFLKKWADSTGELLSSMTVDDIIIDGLLIVTIIHTHSVMATYELQDWQAWPLAIMLDVAVVRLAWVASNYGVSRAARVCAGLGLVFALGTSFGMNYLHYTGRDAGGGLSFWFASIFPLLMAILAATKSFISSQTGYQAVPPVDVIKLYTDMGEALTARIETNMQLSLNEIQGIAHRIPVLVSAEIANQTNRPETAYTVTPILGKAPVSHSIVKSQAIGSRIDKNTAKQTAFDMFDNKQSIRSVATTTGWSVGAVSEWRKDWNNEKN